VIPEFPNFKKIELSDKEEVEKFTKKFPPYSDFNFVSMWVWDIKDEMRISQLHGNLVVLFSDYITGDPFYSFLGDNKVNETIEDLLKLSKIEGINLKLKLIPESSLRGIDENKFLIFEERDHFDYIYPIASVHSYNGSKHKTHRQLVRFFEKKHQFELQQLNLTDKTNQKMLFDLVELWVKNKKNKIGSEEDLRAIEDFNNEYLALKKLFSAPNEILESLVCFSVFVDDELSGFVIEEKVRNDYCISHFGKTNVFHKGNLQFLMQKSASAFMDLGVNYYNDEQDLGLKNLRSSKSSYELSHFLKKYSIALKDNSVL